MGITINSESLVNAATTLNVIGNNIANVNTSGFKQSSFSEQLKKASGGSSETAGITQTFTQGSITSSTNPLDMAISGESLFRLSGGSGITYTRTSNFSVNKDNNIVDAFGNKLTGYSLGSNGQIDDNTLGDITINKNKSSPVATTTIKLNASLDSKPEPSASGTFNAKNPSTYDNSTMTTVFDSSGSARSIQIFFAKNTTTPPPTGTLIWDMYSVDGTNAPVKTTLTFNSVLGTLNQTTAPVVNGIKIDLSGTTEATGSFSANASQDGKASADMSSYKVNNDGTIEAIYVDGTSSVMAQVVLVKFNNLQGLNAMSNNQWTESSLSGTPQIGMAGKGGFGSIQGASTEGSNVDLTMEMVKLIAAQRAFQSAAEVVKKQDETVQTINRIGG